MHKIHFSTFWGIMGQIERNFGEKGLSHFKYIKISSPPKSHKKGPQNHHHINFKAPNLSIYQIPGLSEIAQTFSVSPTQNNQITAKPNSNNRNLLFHTHTQFIETIVDTARTSKFKQHDCLADTGLTIEVRSRLALT